MAQDSTSTIQKNKKATSSDSTSATSKSSSIIPKKSSVKSDSSCTSSSKPIIINVCDTISQTITNAPATYAAWNSTYSMNSKFDIEVNKSAKTITVDVKLKVSGTISDAQKKKWKSSLESKWNNKAVLVNGSDSAAIKYPVGIRVNFVTEKPHFEITAKDTSASEGGRSGIGGTTSMTGWGATDTVDIGHEFGHMLGNTDEYFTCNGVDYAKGSKGFRDSTGGIMNNPFNSPKLNNFELIRKKVESKLGASTLVKP